MPKNEQKCPGKKFDLGKLRYDLLPSEPIKAVVEIFTFGANKYGPNNWQNLEDPVNRYYAALMRHLEIRRANNWKGQSHCPESGKLHMAHMTWNALALLWFEIRGMISSYTNPPEVLPNLEKSRKIPQRMSNFTQKFLSFKKKC